MSNVLNWLEKRSGEPLGSAKGEKSPPQHEPPSQRPPTKVHGAAEHHPERRLRRGLGPAALDASCGLPCPEPADRDAGAHRARPVGPAAPGCGYAAVRPAEARAWSCRSGDAYGYAILFSIIALLLQSLVPLYLGAFLFLSEGTRIENALGALGIRFDPDAIGPDIIKGFALCFAWFALLVSLRDHVPSWLVPWMPPAASWSLIAGIALALGIVDALAAAMIRRAGPWFGLAISPDGLICTMIKLAIAGGALALLVLLGAN